MKLQAPGLVARITDTEMNGNAIARSVEAAPVATTTRISGEKEDFFGGANGQALVEKFESDGHGEAGGFVLRFLVADQEQSRIPYGVNIKLGVEIHLAGETESRAMLVALRKLLGE